MFILRDMVNDIHELGEGYNLDKKKPTNTNILIIHNHKKMMHRTLQMVLFENCKIVLSI